MVIYTCGLVIWIITTHCILNLGTLSQYANLFWVMQDIICSILNFSHTGIRDSCIWCVSALLAYNCADLHLIWLCTCTCSTLGKKLYSKWEHGSIHDNVNSYAIENIALTLSLCHKSQYHYACIMIAFLLLCLISDPEWIWTQWQKLFSERKTILETIC